MDRHQFMFVGNPKDIILEATDKILEIIRKQGAPSHEVIKTLDNDNDKYFFSFGHKLGIVDYLTMTILGVIEDFKGGYILNEKELFEECFKSLSWMVDTLKWQFDNQKSVFGNENQGGYSPELKKAIELRDKLERYLEK